MIWTIGAGVCAQSGSAPGQGRERETTREQRRAELRTALQAGRNADQQVPVEDAVSTGRHLTPQERAEMRQQLRRQQADKPRQQP